MKTEDFDYYLPEELIAQTPLEKRDTSKLLVLDKDSGNIKHEKFSNILDYLNEDDVLVLNDTKVMPARLYGTKEDTDAHIEILMLKECEKDVWECLVKPAKRVKIGTKVVFGEGLLSAVCISTGEEGIREFKLEYTGILYEILDKLEDKDRYQTVYAKSVGSAAAPTAGLHFTNDLLEQIKSKGVQVVYITLHVGLGTFRPVSVDNIENHKMHSEFYMMSNEAARVLNEAKKNDKRIISVGTTSTRTLETIMNLYNEFKECSGWTDIFIYPGYNFKAIDALITNFHLPKSTLLMLISALAGREKVLKAYEEAVNNKYRFFSFGDSMFIK